MVDEDICSTITRECATTRANLKMKVPHYQILGTGYPLRISNRGSGSDFSLVADSFGPAQTTIR